MESHMNCDDIEWLVDLFGTVELLEYVISTPDKKYLVNDVSDRGSVRSAFKAGKGDDGLYFDSAHWYSIKGGSKTDSYTKGYQIKGTAHFCQTFAVMIFLGVDTLELKSGAYAENIRAAMRFWKNLFSHDKKICDFFLENIRTSKHALNSDFLKKMTRKDLMTFMQQVSNDAEAFISCKEG